MRGILSDTVKGYLGGGMYTRNGWYCLRKLARYGPASSRVKGGRCNCGGGADGQGDAPCVLVVRGDGLPFQVVYGPVPPFGV